MDFALQGGLALERGVEVVHVGGVVLVVMDPHRGFVDVGFQRGVVVGQRGQCERHGRAPDIGERFVRLERRNMVRAPGRVNAAAGPSADGAVASAPSSAVAAPTRSTVYSTSPESSARAPRYPPAAPTTAAARGVERTAIAATPSNSQERVGPLRRARRRRRRPRRPGRVGRAWSPPPTRRAARRSGRPPIARARSRAATSARPFRRGAPPRPR